MKKHQFDEQQFDEDNTNLMKTVIPNNYNPLPILMKMITPIR